MNMTQPLYSWVFTKEKCKQVHTKTCTQMFIAAFLVITSNWKQPQCPSTEEWKNKLCVCTMEYCQAMKRVNELLICATK